MKPTRSHLLAACLLAILPGAALTPISAGETRPPEGVVEGYQKLATAIETANMPAFMPLFHRDFLYEALDGSGMDRGPWRRRWLDAFSDHDFLVAAHEILVVEHTSPKGVTLRVRRVLVRESKATGVREVEEFLLRDVWAIEKGQWGLMASNELRELSRGRLPSRLEGDTLSSPRLQALAASLKKENAPELLEAFWKEVTEKGTPLVESGEGDGEVLVTFLVRGRGSEARILLETGAGEGQVLLQLEGSDVWFLTRRYAPGTCLSYSFRTENKVQVPGSPRVVLSMSRGPDLLNPLSTPESSRVELPGAPELAGRQEVEDLPRGSFDRLTVRSKILGERRFVSAYSPAGYEDSDDELPAIFLLGRVTYEGRKAFQLILDTWIATKRLPPSYVFLVHEVGSSRQEFEVTEPFLMFVGEELLAFARTEFPIQTDASSVRLGARGSAAALALGVANRYSGAFGELVLQGGVFTEHPSVSIDLVAELASRKEPLPVKIHLFSGSLDGSLERTSARLLHAVLKSRGHPVEFGQYAGNSNDRTWVEVLERSLLAPGG